MVSRILEMQVQDLCTEHCEKLLEEDTIDDAKVLEHKSNFAEAVGKLSGASGLKQFRMAPLEYRGLAWKMKEANCGFLELVRTLTP